MTVVLTIRTVTALAALATLITAPNLGGSDSAASSSPIPSASLSADQVVDNLVSMNQERAQALLHCEETRVYHLVYRGFPGDREAKMTVEASYKSPSSKEFKVVSQSGSELILDRVFKKLFESEKEAAQPAMSALTRLNRDNYAFTLVGYEPTGRGGNMCCGSARNPGANTSIVARCGWTEPTSRLPALKSNRPRTRRSGRRGAKFIANT